MTQQYVGFGRRLVAALLDGLIMMTVSTLIGFILGLSGAVSTSQQSSLSGLSYAIGLALSIAYYVFYQQRAGQTLGKKALGIKVVDVSGNTPSLMTFFLREIIGKFISSLILGIGYLMVLWDSKKQGLHDKIAGTYVIKV